MGLPIVITALLSLALTGTVLGNSQGDQPARHAERGAIVTFAATKKCKVGFKKGKSPVSLVAGEAVGCLNKLSIAAGKKLLTGFQNSCFACHATGADVPAAELMSNLRTQGYTLSASSLRAAFTAHSDEMSGATMSAADAKKLSQYLQSLPLP